MKTNFYYESDGRMVFPPVKCECGGVHHAVDKDIYVGEGLLDNVPAFIRKRNLGTHCVLVADDNTYRVAGERVHKALTDAGFDVIPCVMHREHVMPDNLSVGEVLVSITRETEFLISVGSGSVTDTTRINAERTGLPFVAVGTAPSMDGYTSVVAPLLHRGNKIQRPAVCPEIIVCDLDVLATAPMPMIASGAGDVLGKYIAKVDWQIGHIVNGEPCCDACVDMLDDALSLVIENVDEIAAKTRKGMKALIEALLLAGVTIMIVGNTRAVASVEHAIAQIWEMKMIARGLTPPMHGASVGVATLLIWPLFRCFAGEELSSLDPDSAVASAMIRQERQEWLLRCFGEEASQQIMREYPEDFLEPAELRRRVEAVKCHEAELKAAIAEMPDVNVLLDVMHRLGAETTTEEEHVPEDLLNLSMWCGKDYRSRYTLLKTLDECGLLEKYLAPWPLKEESAFFG